MAGVQKCASPQASRLQPHPGEDDRDGNYQNDETRQSVPRWRSALVIAPDQQRVVLLVYQDLGFTEKCKHQQNVGPEAAADIV